MATEEVKFIFSMDDRFSEQAKKAEKNVTGLEGGMKKLSDTSGRVAGLIAGAFSVNAVWNFGKAVVQAYGEMEQFKMSLTTMLGGDLQMANALNSQLITLAKTTPFQLSEVQQTSKQLIAYGSSAGEVVNELKTLGNVASGIKAPIGDIAYLYGTIRTQGRAMTVDINQFANRGIPIWKELEKITGKNGMALRKFVEEGKVGFGEIQQVFSNLTGEGGKFFNLMENQSQSVITQISNVKDSWDQLLVSIGQSKTGVISVVLKTASDALNKQVDREQAKNRMDEAYAKMGIPTGNHFISGSNEEKLIHDRMINESIAMQKKISDATTSDSRTGNLQQLNKLLKETAISINDVFKSRYIYSFGEGNKKIALLKQAQEEIYGSMSLVKSNAEKKKPGNQDPNKESEKVKQPHYTQIHININEMIHEYNVKTENSTQLPMITAEHIVRAMTQAVTDAQIVAGI